MRRVEEGRVARLSTTIGTQLAVPCTAFDETQRFTVTSCLRNPSGLQGGYRSYIETLREKF